MTNKIKEERALLKLEAEQLRFKIIVNHAKQKKLSEQNAMKFSPVSTLMNQWPLVMAGWKLFRAPKKTVGKLGVLSGLYALLRLMK